MLKSLLSTPSLSLSRKTHLEHLFVLFVVGFVVFVVVVVGRGGGGGGGGGRAPLRRRSLAGPLHRRQFRLGLRVVGVERAHRAVPVLEEHVAGSLAQVVQDAADLHHFGEVHGQVAALEQQTPPACGVERQVE